MIVVLDKASGKTRKILFHLFGWMIFFSLNYILVSIYQVRFNPYLHLSTWAISIIAFYVSYSFLMPSFLYRKKHFLFASFSILLITSSISINHVLVNYVFEEQILQKTIEIRMQDRNLRGNIAKGGPDESDVRERLRDPRSKPPGRVNMQWIYSILLFYVSGTAISLIERWNKDQKNIKEKEREKILAELSFLKNQVNPHFLFNSLNSIYSLSIQKSDQTTQSILILSNLLRYMLYETQSELVPVQKEFEYISNYLELQKFRVSGKTHIAYSLPESQFPYKIEPLLLIPVIENAFKYGVNNTKESHIAIAFEIIDQEMILQIENNVVKTVENDRSHRSGIGLANLKRRLEILYPEEHILKTSYENNLFSVFIRIKLKQ